MFTIQKELPLPTSPPARYTGMAFDGVSFYVTKACECKLYQYGRRFCLERCHDTCRNYTNICFDPKEGCFWASSDQCGAVVFQLNTCFQEIDCIPVLHPGRCGELGGITGLSYDCGNGTLVVAFASCLISVDPFRQEENTVLLNVTGEWILSVLSISPYLLCYCVTAERQTVKLFSTEGELLGQCEISCADRLEAAVFLPSRDWSGCLHVAALVSRRCRYPYVWACTLPSHLLEAPLCPCNYWKGWKKHPCCEEERPCEKPPCCEEEHPCEKPPCCEEERPCKKPPCCEEERPCEKPPRCEEERPCKKPSCCEEEHPCHKPPCCEIPPCCKEDCDILEAIAQVEKAVAYLLETEGDKLQKILLTTNDPAEILEANRSVQTTIVQATHLEHVVYDILDSLEETCGTEECPL